MSQKIYIPTFISNEEFAPARVQPRIFYFNGKLDTPTYNVYTWNTGSGATTTTHEMNQIPYFDHYNVVSGSFPTNGSNSLLFFNEVESYGTVPSNTLFSEYWDTYIGLLYNPTTRLINAEAVIPLAEYFELELNDIVEWRGNYYHLRAVNDYSFKTGECKLQLLGPIIEDTLDPDSFGTCYNYSVVNNSLFDATYTLTDCDGNPQSGIASGSSSTNIGCAQSGSVVLSFREGEDITLSQGSSCGTYPIYE